MELTERGQEGIQFLVPDTGPQIALLLSLPEGCCQELHECGHVPLPPPPRNLHDTRRPLGASPMPPQPRLAALVTSAP